MSTVKSSKYNPVSALQNNTLRVFNHVSTCAKQKCTQRPDSSCPWGVADGPAGLRQRWRLSRVDPCQEPNSLIQFNAFGSMCYLCRPYFDEASSFHYPCGKSISNKLLMALCIHTRMFIYRIAYRSLDIFSCSAKTKGHSCDSSFAMTS